MVKGPEHGSDKVRFECCVNNLGNPQYLRAIQGHVGDKMDEHWQRHVQCPHGHNFCIILDLHPLAGPSWKVTSQEEAEGKACLLLYGSESDNIPVIPRFTGNEPRMIRKCSGEMYRIQYWFDFRNPRQRLCTLSKQELCDTTVQHHAIRGFGERGRNKDDSQVEILDHKESHIREEIGHIRLKEHPNAAPQAVCDDERLDRPILKITPRTT